MAQPFSDPDYRPSSLTFFRLSKLGFVSLYLFEIVCLTILSAVRFIRSLDSNLCGICFFPNLKHLILKSSVQVHLFDSHSSCSFGHNRTSNAFIHNGANFAYLLFLICLMDPVLL